MSEYQYYEFQTLDRSLTKKEMQELRDVSSRGHVTATRFVNQYNYGSFKGDPDEWMETYFDAFLYMANWGTRRFMLRLPEKSLPREVIQQYVTSESLTFRIVNGYTILCFQIDDEEPDWIEGEEWLDSLVSLRSDLMRGDYRCLYLGWLLGVQYEAFDDVMEPPVPSGLGELNDALESFVDFLLIDSSLIAAAAEASPKKKAEKTLSQQEIIKWVADLPLEEKNDALVKIIDEDPLAITELKSRVYQEIIISKSTDSSETVGHRRSDTEIRERAEQIVREKEQKRAERLAREEAERLKAEAAAREKHLKAITGQEESLWKKVHELIATRQPKAYDESVSLLKDLLELASRQNKEKDFSVPMTNLAKQHARKLTLIERFQKAGLMK